MTVKETLQDDYKAVDRAAAFIFAFALSALIAVPSTIIHETLHYIGAVLSGGNVVSVTWFDAQAWISQFLIPLEPAGPLGSIEVTFGPTDPTYLFYFLPYIVLPLSLALVFADNLNLPVNPRWAKIIGAPLFYFHFVALFYDYQLYTGVSPADLSMPIPGIFLKLFYLGVIVAGYVGMSVYRELPGTETRSSTSDRTRSTPPGSSSSLSTSQSNAGNKSLQPGFNVDVGWQTLVFGVILALGLGVAVGTGVSSNENTAAIDQSVANDIDELQQDVEDIESSNYTTNPFLARFHQSFLDEDFVQQATATNIEDDINRSLYLQEKGYNDESEMQEVEASTRSEIKADTGRLFAATHVETDIASDGDAYYILETSDVEPVQTRFGITSTGSVMVEVYEGASINSDPTKDVEVQNLKRTSTLQANTTWYNTTDSTDITSFGNRIEQYISPTGTQIGESTGGAVSDGAKWVFQSSETYLIAVENVGSSSIDVSLSADFYENKPLT